MSPSLVLAPENPHPTSFFTLVWTLNQMVISCPACLFPQDRDHGLRDAFGQGWKMVRGSAHFTEDKAMGQNGEVICVRSQSKMVEELVPVLWAERSLPAGVEAFVCVCLQGEQNGGGGGTN